MMATTNKEASAQQQALYQSWLQSKHVSVRTDLVKTTNENVVAGWGCVATADIKKGSVLFRIPRAACFAAACSDNDKSDCDNDPTTRDSQKSLALRYLQLKSDDRWSPFLNLLTPQTLPWTLRDDYDLKCLVGTELELVVHRKLSRIQAEYEDVMSSDNKTGGTVSYQEYLEACSIVASHANPWFGVSIVPFNTTLNWGREVNVEFDLEGHDGDDECSNSNSSASESVEGNNDHEPSTKAGEAIVGRAICNIKKGSELFQSYGDSTAELLYRCGFAPNFEGADSNDSLSLFVGEIIRVVEALLLNSSSVKSNEHCDELQVNIPTSSVITDLESKIGALKKSGAIDSSSWDKMEDCLTAELTSPSPEFINMTSSNQEKHANVVSGKKRQRDQEDHAMNNEERAKFDDGGVSKLIGACLVLLTDKESWQHVSAAIDNLRNNASQEENEEDVNSNDSESNDKDEEEESRSDDITASILLSSLANVPPQQSANLQQLALDVGMGGHDPWRALLLQICSSKALKWDMAIQAAKLVIEKKMARLNKGEDVFKLLTTENKCKEKDVLEAIQMLRVVERSLLTRALNILDTPFR